MSTARSRVFVAATVAISGFVLGGCGQDEAPAGRATSDAPGSAAAAPASPTAAAKPTGDTLPPSGNAGQAITAPGTALAFGEPAYLEIEKGDKGSKYWSRSIVKVTVVEIRKGSEADLAKLENAAKFKGYTPYYIESENEIVFFEGARYSLPRVDLDPVGTGRTGSMFSIGGFEACKSSNFDTGVSPIGAKSKPCDIGVGVNGGVVTGARFDGESSSDYAKKSVTWGDAG
jgi:hypothetical protein